MPTYTRRVGPYQGDQGGDDRPSGNARGARNVNPLQFGPVLNGATPMGPDFETAGAAFSPAARLGYTIGSGGDGSPEQMMSMLVAGIGQVDDEQDDDEHDGK